MHAGVPRTKLFINLTAGLELLRYVPAAQQAVIEAVAIWNRGCNHM
jgi:hypothetical protein